LQENEFNKHFEQFTMWLLEQFPAMATQMGIHTWDDRLMDCSNDTMVLFHSELQGFLTSFLRYNSRNFSKDARIDYTLAVQLVKSLIRDIAVNEPYLRNPGFYLDEVMNGVFGLIMKDFAPLSERLTNLLQRVTAVPRVLREAQNNLQPSRVPLVWAEVALEQADMGEMLFLNIIPAIAETDELKQELMSAGKSAVAAMDSFATFLKEKVIPVAAGDFAAGESLFNELLRENHMVNYDSEELLATGWSLFQETKELMDKLALTMNSQKTIEEIIEDAKADHPTAEGLLDAHREAMESARRFVVEHEIATIPEGETLSVIETPPFMRPLIPFAAYLPPGIYEQDLSGIFLVTPPSPEDPPEIAESKLRGQHYAKLPITALHEAYPGHHLQLVVAAKYGTTARKLGMSLSSLFIEGWAFYCEELMEQEGYINQPAQRLGRLHDQLWRAARIILDVSLHTKGMSVQQAVDFLVERCQLDPGNALAEVRRYTMMPTQPQSYLMGKLEILKIVDQYRHRNPGASMKEMHDDILLCGSLTPKLLAEQLFN